MKTSFIDNRMTSEVPQEFFPETCTVQTLVTSSNAEGEIIETWTDYVGHTNLKCSVSPISGDEQRSNLTYGTSTHSISLTSCYPTISQTMRVVVDETTYDIVEANHSGYETNTVLNCLVVSV